MSEKKRIIELDMDGERVFLRKGRLGEKSLGWKVVYPSNFMLKKEGKRLLDKKTHLKNLIAGGKWSNLFWITLGVGLIMGCIWEYSVAIKSLNICMERIREFSVVNFLN